MRYTPIKKKGKRGKLNDIIRAKVWPAVLERARYRCEGCQGVKPLEWAHLFGRPGSGFCLGAWANAAQLTAALCRNCHNGVDRHTDERLAARLRGGAVDRLQRMLLKPVVFPGDGSGDQVRIVIAKLEKEGWRFDEEICSVVGM